jgi:hypothetical protein
MAFDITAASAEELELEPAARVHRMGGHRRHRRGGVCCGWTRKILRARTLPARAQEA